MLTHRKRALSLGTQDRPTLTDPHGPHPDPDPHGACRGWQTRTRLGDHAGTCHLLPSHLITLTSRSPQETAREKHTYLNSLPLITQERV